MKHEKEMQQLIDAFIETQNAHNSQGFAALFTGDAEVEDEGKKYKGSLQIKEWNDETIKKYNTSNELVSCEVNEDKIMLVLKVSGTFPGSPVNITFRFKVYEGKIKMLTIK